VIVVGDVNSTIAASLVARKLFIPVSHVEAGLRSFDETMPEELNRRLTDCLSNLLFVSEPSGVENLKREGMDMSRVHLVGDIMLETLQMFLPTISKARRWESFGLQRGAYALVTLHRPSNVDSAEALAEVLDILEIIALPIIFPIHPRTLKRAAEFGLNHRLEQVPDLLLTGPLPYVDFLSLMEGSRFVFSDSGSVQAEASFFNVLCLIGRENTERPIYLQEGTSVLVGRDKQKIADILESLNRGESRQSSPMIKKLGSGVGAQTVDIIVQSLG
jgi:UDP-N-acetylglucosamine 2-epimerase (non-hydrolysing)